jgi:Fe-S-cluster containining protein
MNRKERRAQEAKTRAGQGPEAANRGARMWDKIFAAEAKTVSDMLEDGMSRQKVDEVIDNARNFALGFQDENTRIACGAGCYYCCYQKVGTTGLEIVHIATWMREHIEPERLAKFVTALEEIVKQRPANESRPVRCCFLSEEGFCQIYEARPLSCRSVTSFDSEPCRQWLEEGKPLGKVADQRRYTAHHATMHGLDKGTTVRGFNGGFIDFHVALHMALADEGVVERWYEGENVFGVTTIPPKVRRLFVLE